MQVNLNNLMNTPSSDKISLMAALIKGMMDPMSAFHVCQHIEAKLLDSSEKGCTKNIDDFLSKLFRMCDPDEIRMLLDTLYAELETSSIGGVFRHVTQPNDLSGRKP